MNIIYDVPPVLDDKWISLDTEWANLNQKTIHRPTSGSFAAMTISDGENVWFMDTQEKALEAMKRIQRCKWWIHEAKFDLIQLSRFVPWELQKHDQLIDTILMERIVYAGYYDRFSLADLARRYLGIYVEKELQKSFQGGILTKEQVDYACLDAFILHQVGTAQAKIIKTDDFYIWKNVDLPMLWAVMNFQGFRLDTPKWIALAEKNKLRQQEIDAQLPINPRSPKQVKSQLIELGFKKLPDTNEDTLDAFMRKYPDTDAAKLAEKILESRKYGKRASTYGMSWIKDFIETEDGIDVIHADYNITKAETGRMSANSPNMQNVPIRETSEYRECFIPRPDHVLIVGDFSQQEIGIEAYLSGDEKMIDIFNSGKDIYIQTAKEMFNKEIEKNDPLRKRMKAVVLGLDYGLTEYGLSKKENISLEEARELIKIFKKKFHRMAEYQLEQSKLTYQTKTVLGRRCWLNPYQYRCGNNALNNPIQGTAADMMKISVGQMFATWPFPIPFNMVGVVHDEDIADCPKEYAEDEAKFIKDTMENIANWMLPGMKFRADVKICQNSWAEKG